MLEFVCAFCVGICLRLSCFGVIKLIKKGNTPSILKDSPLGHILDKWAKHSYEPMTKKDMIYYCNRVWTQYMLGSEERWAPEWLTQLSYDLAVRSVLQKSREKR